MLTQEEWVQSCLSKYRWEPLPADQQWEAAHFPLPKCSGEDDTVLLWSADHTVQGLLQSVEFDHRCFHTYRNEHDTNFLTIHYPEYLPLFQQLKSEFSSRQGKKSAAIHQSNGTGFHALGVRSAGGKKASATTNTQRWQCLVTGFITNSGSLSRYQKKRGIDTSLRTRRADLEG